MADSANVYYLHADVTNSRFPKDFAGNGEDVEETLRKYEHIFFNHTHVTMSGSYWNLQTYLLHTLKITNAFVLLG